MTKSRFARNAFLVFLLALAGCDAGYNHSGSKVTYTHYSNFDRTSFVIKGADASTFKVLEHKAYAKDKAYAYFRGFRFDVDDVESFHSIHDYYAIDAQSAYIGRRKIKGSDGPTFRLLDEELADSQAAAHYWSKDKNDAYDDGYPVGACDPDTFEPYKEEYRWAKDRECVYLAVFGKLPVQDRDSFEIVGGSFWKDSSGVYYATDILEGADPETFELVAGVGRDKQSCWTSKGPIDCQSLCERRPKLCLPQND